MLLFLTPCLVVAVQPCMECIPIKKILSLLMGMKNNCKGCPGALTHPAAVLPKNNEQLLASKYCLKMFNLRYLRVPGSASETTKCKWVSAPF